MNTYYITVAANAEAPPLEFYLSARSPGEAIIGALNRAPAFTAAVITCHLHAPESQAHISFLQLDDVTAPAMNYTEHLHRLRMPLPPKC